MKSMKFTLLAVIICVLASAFYMYEFTLQVSLGVMTDELMQDLGLNAASLGLVSAFYYYAYTPMQVPAGLLHDRFGPRRILTIAILTCALGAFCFSLSTNIASASAGRFLMGVGSAFSFSGALILIARWFPPAYFAVLSGIVQLMSSVGAIGGELPLAITIHHWGWRPSMVYLALLGILLAILVWFIVKDSPHEIPSQKHLHRIDNDDMTQKFKLVFGRASTWWVATYSFLIWAPIATFAGLWGVPFLANAYHLTTAEASMACAAIWIGVGLGSPLSGWISEYIQRRCIVLTCCGMIGIISTLVVIYGSVSMPVLYFALFAFGVASGGQSLAFCVVRDNSHPGSIGAAIGFNNMATVAGGAIIQPLVGYLLYLNWDGTYTANHLPLYSTADYHLGLFMIPLCYVLSTVVSLLFVKETHCQQQFAY
ncbi:MAG TPA: MFS transporter [Gammaproteobacteria bacterium]|nr:MFS transporter [Gammaproteobacteria bacterium]